MNNLQPIVKKIIIGLGIVIASAGLTMGLVTVFYKKPSAVNTTNQANTTLGAAELIKKYTSDNKLDGYTLNTSIVDSTIAYKLSDASYTVQINSLYSVQFAKTANSIADDVTKAVDNSKSFLTSNGLKAVSDKVYADQTQLLYDSQNTVCKISNSFDPTKKTSAYGLVCADKPSFIAERNSIQTLLDLYTKSGGTNDFNNIVRTTHTQDNIAVSLLSISSKFKTKAPYTLIFAAINNKWTYVGSRVTPSIDVKDSFKLSDSLKAAVNDPKYNGLLAKYVY